MKKMPDCDCPCHENHPHHVHRPHLHHLHRAHPTCPECDNHGAHECDCGQNHHYHRVEQPGGCNCDCHRVHHPNLCHCGRPSCRRCANGGPTCPPPPVQAQPGTVDIPQPTPFTGPFQQGPPPVRPAGVDEVSWLQGQILNTTRNGPAFGPRKDAYLPWLLVRSNAGDNGARPFNGWFWESPDIFGLSNTDPANAPLIPDFSAGVVQIQAGAPATLYAHVWNLGKAAAFRVRVEFYWFDPTLGIARTDANLIGAAWIDLGDRFTRYPNWVEMTGPSGTYASRGCHAIVKCPVPWVPSMIGSGHECLVVRAFEPIMDATPYNSFAAATDRHVGQRNISVVQAHSPAQIDLPLSLGYPANPGTIEVGFDTAAPQDVPWIGMLGPWAAGLSAPSTPVVAGFMPPTPRTARMAHVSAIADECRPALLHPTETFTAGCDPLQIQFHASAPKLKHNEGTVLRIRQRQNGDIIGGYTIVLYRR
jgi:hypothetical protein